MGENPLVRKLKNVASLTPEEIEAVERLCTKVQEVPARSDIISEGDRPECVHLVLEGWAARYKIINKGERQITAFLIPGDLCDVHVAVLAQMDHSIAALTDCKIAYMPSAELDELTRNNSNFTRALWWATLLDEAVLREWVINNGKRSAHTAIAHLLCEMHVRMKMVGLVEDTHFSLPLTQDDLASATGLTSVHTNRVIQKLKAEGLIELRSRTLTIFDLEGLREAAGFEADYFHLRSRPRGRASNGNSHERGFVAEQRSAPDPGR